MEKKCKQLKKNIKKYGKLVIAYSGGVDSTFLLKMAIEVLGKNNVVAVIAKSPTYPESEMVSAVNTARLLGAKYKIIKTNELDNKKFVVNPRDRCYYCKKELFQKLKKIGEQYNITQIAEGSNYDDLKDYRPGRKAVIEFGIKSPLLEAKLRKQEIRALSKQTGLPTWDKPSYACLASRIPYNTIITEEKLKRIDCAENILKKTGFYQVRVREHNDLARIEVEPKEIYKLINPNIKRKIINSFLKLGYLYITLDLEGYKTGSMNKQIRIRL